jgi:hypothetical protein
MALGVGALNWGRESISFLILSVNFWQYLNFVNTYLVAEVSLCLTVEDAEQT